MYIVRDLAGQIHLITATNKAVGHVSNILENVEHCGGEPEQAVNMT